MFKRFDLILITYFPAILLGRFVLQLELFLCEYGETIYSRMAWG
jgi:hypothetical protein